MIRLLRNPLAYILLIALFLSACATPRPNAVWMDPSYHSHPARIMVIGVAKSAANRRIFEDEFVRRLTAHGVQAIASYTVLPDELQEDHKAIADKVAELGADTVLITRLVSRKTVQNYVPGTVYFPPTPYGTWPNYYDFGYEAIYLPGYVAEQELAEIETNLYDASNDKLIWASTTELDTRGAIPDRIREYIGIVTKAMVRQGLLH